MKNGNLFSSASLRLWWIPFFMGLVWIASFFVSFFYDYDGLSTLTHLLIRLVSAFNIILFFEILLMFWDIKLSLKGYNLHVDHAFIAQCRTVPFLICGYAFAFMAFRYPEFLLLYIAVLFLAKISMHHIVVYVDNHKTSEYGDPEPI